MYEDMHKEGHLKLDRFEAKNSRYNLSTNDDFWYLEPCMLILRGSNLDLDSDLSLLLI